MGHVNSKKEYLGLQKRLDRMPIGAPPHKALFGILEEVFSPEESRIASVMPLKLSTAGKIGKLAGMDRKRIDTTLNVMVEKGLVVDLQKNSGKTYYFLNPAVIGFFEFTMMRVRDSIDQKKVSKLIWEYIREDPDLAFMRMVADGMTFISRPLVHEDALEPEVFSEVLDYEKASEIIRNAGSWAMGICHCRHVKMHLGKQCDYPLDHCLSLGNGAEYLIKAKIAERIEMERALDILDHARENNCVQMGDNVKNRPTFICNCCKCCCEMMEGFRTLPQENKVVSSNYVASINEDTCNGCGKCAKVCPIEVISLVPAAPTENLKKRKKMAVVNQELCLGCAVCHRECRADALTLDPIGERVYTPETMMEKMMRQAIEKGKIQNMLFDDHTKVTHRILGTFLGSMLNLPPAKRLLASEQVKSKFVRLMLEGMSKTGQGWMSKL